MLGLKMATDPRWVRIAEQDLQEILTDHAWCEQKAASNAISLCVQYPEYPDMVKALIEVAREELEHFDRVHQKLLDRGYKLGRERKDPYVADLQKFIRKGGSMEQNLVDRLLLSAMIEARSCERFRILSNEINDPDLREFYHELMVSEAGHFTLFLGFARKYGQGIDVEKSWQDFLEFEGRLIRSYGTRQLMHG